MYRSGSTEIGYSTAHFLAKTILFHNNITETEITFLAFTLLTLYSHIPSQCFHWLEQSRNNYGCFEKISVQFLLTGTNRKGGIFNESLLNFDLGSLQNSFPHQSMFFKSIPLLMIGKNLIGCHIATLVLIFIQWQKSIDKSC